MLAESAVSDILLITLNARYAATIDLIRAMGGCYGGPDEQRQPSSKIVYSADK